MISSRRVLFVEPEESLQRLVHHVLAHAGIEVDSVSGSDEAISLLAQNPYDVVLLDVIDHSTAAHEVVRGLGLLARPLRPVVLAVSEPFPHPPLDSDIVSLVLRKPYDLTMVTDVVIACVGAHVAGLPDPAASKEQFS